MASPAAKRVSISLLFNIMHSNIICVKILQHILFGLHVLSCLEIYMYTSFVELVTQLAAAESRCAKLERQLDHMKSVLRNDRTERTSHLNQQVNPMF